MTKELLLEAIGYVDEQLLIEAKETPRRGHYRIGRVVLIAAIIALLTVSVMASTGFFAGLLKAEENGSSVSNLSTGMGNFVYTATEYTMVNLASSTNATLAERS